MIGEVKDHIAAVNSLLSFPPFLNYLFMAVTRSSALAPTDKVITRSTACLIPRCRFHQLHTSSSLRKNIKVCLIMHTVIVLPSQNICHLISSFRNSLIQSPILSSHYRLLTLVNRVLLHRSIGLGLDLPLSQIVI